MMIRLNCLSRPWWSAVLALFFLCGYCYSQDAAKKTEEDFLDPDPDFEATNIPAKWKNESAVIICQKNSYFFDKSKDLHYGNAITQKEVIRKRIKLLDRAAVEEYSEFYFVETKDLGVKIIHPGGSTDIIDLKDAVPVAKDVSIPGVYKSSYNWEKNYQKLAIAGLEPNDIIDYFTIIDHTYYITKKEYVFPEVFLSLENAFPVVKQKFLFEVDNELFFNFSSSNGAPEVQEGESGKEGILSYTLTDNNRESIKDERWSYIYRSTPSFKFQVVYKTDLKIPTEYFLGMPGHIKTSVSKEEVAIKANQLIMKPDKSISKLSGMILKYLSSHKEITDQDEIARASYYLYRNLKYTRGKNNFGKNDDKIFVKCLAKVFDKKKVNYKIIVAVPVHIGTLDDLVLKDELTWFMRIDDSGKYITTPSINANYGDIHQRLQGVAAYQIKTNKNQALVRTEKITMPFTHLEQNGESSKMEVSLNKDMDELTIDQHKTIRGYNRNSYEDAIIYEDSKSPEKYSFQVSTDMSGVYEQKRKRVERFKSYAAENFDLVSYDEFSLVNSGRYDDDPLLEYKEKYRIKGIIRGAGVNYILQVGKLIGTQIEINDEELKRTYDIFSDCPRSFFNDISMVVPDGYTVKGIEKLNVDLFNEAGSFSSKAWMEEGNIFRITTSKTYLHNFEKKEEWEKIVQFLDAAYDFTQTRILLKKTK